MARTWRATAKKRVTVAHDHQHIQNHPAFRRLARRVNGFLAADFLSSFDAEQRHQLERIATSITYSPGEICLAPHEMRGRSFILRRGKIRLFYSFQNGDTLSIAELRPGAVFGEMPLLGQRAYGAQAEAVEESVLWILSRPDLEQLLLNHPRLALRLIQLLGQQLLEAEGQLEETLFKNIRARTAALLLRRASSDPPAVTGLSHQEIADQLGVYRETITHALNELRQMGLIEIGRRKLRIVDPEGLRREAKPSPQEWVAHLV